MEFVHLHVISKKYKALRAQTDFKISWRRWTGINSIFCWLVKRGEVNMKKLFSLRMATSFSWVAVPLVDMELELLLGGHCTNVCQTWCFMHIPTGYVRYISLWKMCLFKFFRVTCLHPGNSWEPYHEVEQMYDLMECFTFKLRTCWCLSSGRRWLQCNVRWLPGSSWQRCPWNVWNDRGWMMAHWVARTGLLVQSRLDPHVNVEDSWTCRRAMDGQLVQIDYILTTGNLALVRCKYDHSMPVGLDHRCVHCMLQLCVGKRKKLKRRISFKNWRPQLDHDHAPTPYQNHIRQVAKLKSGYCWFIGANLNSGRSKAWPEQSSNDMFSSIHASETSSSIAETDKRSTLEKNMELADSESSLSWGTCLENESTSNISWYDFNMERLAEVFASS